MLVEPVVGEEQENECSPCIASASSNCDNYSADSIAEAGPGVDAIPVDAIQCPIRYPFTKYQDDSDQPSFEIGYCVNVKTKQIVNQLPKESIITI